MTCIKTAAIVKVLEYGRAAVADIHAAGDCLVVRFPGNFDSVAGWPEDLAAEGRPVTHELVIGIDSYWNKQIGVAVVPATQLTEV